MSEAANQVPDRLFVVARDEGGGATENGYALPYLAFWRKEGAFAWLRGQDGEWAVTEVPIYPAFPAGPWHAQVPVEAAAVPEASGIYARAKHVCIEMAGQTGQVGVLVPHTPGDRSAPIATREGLYDNPFPVVHPPRATGDDGDEPALAARAREGGA